MTVPSTLHTQIHTRVLCLYLSRPIPVVLRCYLSLTCRGCQVLMDDKQIGWREEQKHQDMNNASFCILLLVCLSLHTQLQATGRHRGPCLKTVSLGQFSRKKMAQLFGLVSSFSVCSEMVESLCSSDL